MRRPHPRRVHPRRASPLARSATSTDIARPAKPRACSTSATRDGEDPRHRLPQQAHRSRGPATAYVLGFGVDISEQVRAEGRLRTLTRQSNSILESVGDGIFGIDLDGNVTVVNPAAAADARLQAGRDARPQHARAHPPHTRRRHRPTPHEDSPIRNSLDHLDTVRVADEVFWRKDGTSFPVEYVARPQIERPTIRADISAIRLRDAGRPSASSSPSPTPPSAAPSTA